MANWNPIGVAFRTTDSNRYTPSGIMREAKIGMAASIQMLLIFLHTLLLLFIHRSYCKTLKTIDSSFPLHDGDVLLSENKIFALGFFSPNNSTRRFIGIWYSKVSEQTVFWVANRDRPINDTSGFLSINSRGDLVLQYCSNGSSPVWSTNMSTTNSENATTNAQLQDTGNFILLEKISSRVLWQSFDYPTDTMTPFMKLGLDRKTGMDRFLTSWKSKDDPGPGNFTYRIDPTGFLQLFLYKSGAPHWRAGPWTGLRWSGVPQMIKPYIFNVSFVNDQEEVALSFGLRDMSIISRMVVDPSGLLQRSSWNDDGGRWIQFYATPEEQCDYYGTCGPNSNCNPYNMDQFSRTCLPGFEPRSPKEWFLRDGSSGCMRSPGPSTCRSGEGFIKVARVKVPDTSRAHADMNMDLKECEKECFKNCSCTAYTAADESRVGFGCLAWYDDLLDTGTFSAIGQDLYIRVDSAVLARLTEKKGFPGKWIGAIISAGVIVVLLLLIFLFIMKKRRGRRRPSAPSNAAYFHDDESPSMHDLEEDGRNTDLPFFDLSTIAAASNNFSFINKLGQGGFGPVYKVS
ncbi:hypothetical protein CRG98_006633 [Punica granatum]|uniref:Uncharacterized protein n=1 Tax=Punica granatum TaxID=22663 RepID=A0A2I0KX43_PUNGR|nr:hypothetical protein CRG98_006633 [Punica granatum]